MVIIHGNHINLPKNNEIRRKLDGKYYICMYLDGFALCIRILLQKDPIPKTYDGRMYIVYAICYNYIYFNGCTEYQVLIRTEKYICQLYRLLATCSQTLVKVNRTLSEVLVSFLYYTNEK